MSDDRDQVHHLTEEAGMTRARLDSIDKALEAQGKAVDSLPKKMAEAVEAAFVRANTESQVRHDEAMTAMGARCDELHARMDSHLRAHGQAPEDVGRPEGCWSPKLDPEVANELVQIKRRPKSVATLLAGLLVSVVGLVSPAAAAKIKAGFVWLMK